MYYIFFLTIVALFFAWVHIALIHKNKRTAKRKFEIILLYLLFFCVGLAGLLGAAALTFLATKTAYYMGWPAGNPFQHEVAMIDLAFGVLGILCLWFRGNFWLAVIIGLAVFDFGAAYGHIKEIILHHNYAPGNAGIPLYADIIKPIVLIVLYILYRALPSRETRKKS